LGDHAAMKPDGKHTITGIHEWGGSHALEISIERLRRYPKVYPRDELEASENCHHRIWVRLQVDVQGLDVHATWQIAPPGSKRARDGKKPGALALWKRCCSCR